MFMNPRDYPGDHVSIILNLGIYIINMIERQSQSINSDTIANYLKHKSSRLCGFLALWEEREIMNNNIMNNQNQNQMPVYLGTKEYVEGNKKITDTYFQDPITKQIWRERQTETYTKI